MAALKDVQTYATGQVTAAGLSITPTLWADISPFIASFFWAWYRAHLRTILLRTGFLFIHFTIRVQDLHNLFESLFGPEPTAAA